MHGDYSRGGQPVPDGCSRGRTAVSRVEEATHLDAFVAPSSAVMKRSRVNFAERPRRTLRSETVGIGSGAGTGKSEMAGEAFAVTLAVASAATGVAGSGGFSMIGIAMILALAVVPTVRPYCPTLMTLSTSAKVASLPPVVRAML